MGIVNKHAVHDEHGDSWVWKAHNANFCSIRGTYKTRMEAAAAISTGKTVAIEDVG